MTALWNCLTIFQAFDINAMKYWRTSDWYWRIPCNQGIIWFCGSIMEGWKEREKEGSKVGLMRITTMVWISLMAVRQQLHGSIKSIVKYVECKDIGDEKWDSGETDKVDEWWNEKAERMKVCSQERKVMGQEIKEEEKHGWKIEKTEREREWKRRKLEEREWKMLREGGNW